MKPDFFGDISTVRRHELAGVFVYQGIRQLDLLRLAIVQAAVQISAKAAEFVDAGRLAVVSGLDHCMGILALLNRGPQQGAEVAVSLVALHADAACTQWKLTVNLVEPVPPGLLHGGADELVADVAFGELFLVQAGARVGFD